MKNSDYIPRKDADLLAWTVAFLAALSAILTRVGFPQTVYTVLTTLLTTFKEALAIATAPATRTKAAVAAKDDARKALVRALRSAIMQYLTYNPDVTNADHENLGLPIHKTEHTPAPVATTYPDYDINSGTIRRLTIHFYDQGSSGSKAKPDGQHGAEIRWAILETPPASINDLIRSSFDTRTPFTLEFDENQRGQTVYFCLCWENTRGEKGPWSEIMSAIVP
jgi:hypothetical protein